jgi:signal transduction histidine kinase/HAMP domain-containing protein
MNVIKFKSIRSRLIFWFILTTSASILVILSIIYLQRSQIIKAESKNRLISLRNSKVLQIENWLEERNADIHFFANSIKEVPDNLECIEGDATYKLINSELLAASLHYNSYIDIFLLDSATGMVNFSSNEELIGEILKELEPYTSVIKNSKFTITDIYYSDQLSTLTMAYSIPLWKKNSDSLGFDHVLVARIDLNNSLYKILENKSGQKKSGETLLVNKEGYAVSKLKRFNDAELKIKIDAEPAFKAYTGNTGTTIANDYRDVEVLAAYAYIPKTGWGLICKEDLDELNEPLESLLLTVSLIFIISIIFFVIVSFLISNNLIRSIIHLNKFAKELTAGNLKIRYENKTNDEIGKLGLDFNNMADSIESRIKILDGISTISKSLIKTNSFEEFGKTILYEIDNLTTLQLGALYHFDQINYKFSQVTLINNLSDYTNYLEATKPGKIIKKALEMKSIYHKQLKYLKNVFDDVDYSFENKKYDVVIIPIIIDEIVKGTLILIVEDKFEQTTIDILTQSWNLINISFSNISKKEDLQNATMFLEKTNRELELKTADLKNQYTLSELQSQKLVNITKDLQQKNETLDHQKKQLQQLTNLKSEFISTMSHELKTPLNSILSLSKVLTQVTQEKLDETELNYLKIIIRNGENLLKIIDQILDLSKIEAGKSKVVFSPFSLKSLLISLTENIQTIAEDKGIEIKSDINTDLSMVNSDEMRVFHILNNIIGNAVKYTNRGYVSVKATEKEGVIKVEVKDTGIGIKKEDLNAIFDEFYQVDSLLAREHEGTGLGLAIAKKNAEILGIDILVESKIKNGSTFTIKIPVDFNNATNNTH